MTQQSEVIRKLDRILSYLEDDSATGRKGLYSRQDDTEKRLEDMNSRITVIEYKQKKFKKNLTTVAAFFGLGSTTLTAAYLKWEAFINFIKHARI